MRRVMPDLQPVVKQLDELIRESIEELQFAVKWKRPFYGVAGLGWVIEIAAYDVSANVVFLGGADFESPPPLGSGGRDRYVKVRDVEDVLSPRMRIWIEQAGRVSGWK
jgi:hypothetical protein